MLITVEGYIGDYLCAMGTDGHGRIQGLTASLMDGVVKCISCFEKNTAGIDLAIGYVKSLLSSLIGKQTNTMLSQAHIPTVTLTNVEHDSCIQLI